MSAEDIPIDHTPDGPADSAATAAAIGRELAPGADIHRFPEGSVPVYAIGERLVVKLFPPGERAFFETECAALERIGGALPVPTPRLVAAGERGGWLYVAMTRLAGESLAGAWHAIAPHDRRQLVREAGTMLAALHAIPTDDLAPLAVDWPGFMAAQLASAGDRQRAKGLGAPWADAVDGFLARWAPPETGERALLHTEVMREHLLVEYHNGRPRLSGLVDFEPAMVGAPHYDLASVGIFVTCAEAGLLGVFLDAYGLAADRDLPYRIMAYALLHRYSNLRWYLERLPAADDVGDLESLALRWFTP